MLPICGGCSLIVPQKAHRPVIRNPFPQLSRVAIAPFFNQSDEPTVDGRQVALAYFAELQSTPGFEVVPLGVVEEAIIANRVDLNGAGEARRLAKILGVDVVVVGAVTDFAEYYPPRIGLRVEWYTANPGFHEIPAGYGLPWGTPEEEFIPDSLVYESQMALAKAEFAARTPDCEGVCVPLPPPPVAEGAAKTQADGAPVEGEAKPGADGAGGVEAAAEDALQEGDAVGEPVAPAAEAAPEETTLKIIDRNVRYAQSVEELPAREEPTDEANPRVRVDAGGEGAGSEAGSATGTTRASDGGGAIAADGGQWPDPQCPAPAAAAVVNRPPCVPWHGPVLSHTRIYRGNDADLTEALEGYVSFRDDMRFGGWKSYLARSEDFVRFCCHMHICEMLSARGGSRKTEVVYRWPESR
jgi:hypothetical protein